MNERHMGRDLGMASIRDRDDTEGPSKGTPGLMRVSIGARPEERTAVHTQNGIRVDNAVSLKVTASDPEGHLVEVQIAALGNGELNIIVFGANDVGTDGRGDLRIHAWPVSSPVWGVGGSRRRTDGR